MQAIAYTAYGGPEVTQIINQPIPQPGPGEVQIKVAAGSLNPIDWHQRKGELKAVHPQTLPVIAGNDFAGRISALGHGVSGFQIGDPVICRVTKTKWGALAEYVVVPSDIIAKAPASVSLEDAAGLPLAGLTAEQALDELDIQKGDRLLITGGAGGVGLFAIQLAKIRGAHVTVTASEAGRTYVEKAGVDVVVNYKTQKLIDLPDSERFDKVFDTVGGERALVEDVIPSVKPGGKIISVGGPQTPGCLDNVLSWYMRPIVNLFLGYRAWSVLSAARSRRVVYEYTFMRPDGEQLGKLAKLVDDGKLVITIVSRYPMAEFGKAFEQLESGRSKGKVIIEFK